MKTFLNDLWKVRSNIFYGWLFLFIISLIGESPNTVFELFLISGIITFVMISCIVLYVRSKIK